MMIVKRAVVVIMCHRNFFTTKKWVLSASFFHKKWKENTAPKINYRP